MKYVVDVLQAYDSGEENTPEAHRVRGSDWAELNDYHCPIVVGHDDESVEISCHGSFFRLTIEEMTIERKKGVDL